MVFFTALDAGKSVFVVVVHPCSGSVPVVSVWSFFITVVWVVGVFAWCL